MPEMIPDRSFYIAQIVPKTTDIIQRLHLKVTNHYVFLPVPLAMRCVRTYPDTVFSKYRLSIYSIRQLSMP